MHVWVDFDDCDYTQKTTYMLELCKNQTLDILFSSKNIVYEEEGTSDERM